MEIAALMKENRRLKAELNQLKQGVSVEEGDNQRSVKSFKTSLPCSRPLTNWTLFQMSSSFEGSDEILVSLKNIASAAIEQAQLAEGQENLQTAKAIAAQKALSAAYKQLTEEQKKYLKDWVVELNQGKTCLNL